MANFYNSPPIFYFHVKPDQQVFGFDILADVDDIPLHMMAKIEGIKVMFENKPLDASALVKSLIDLIRKS